jgi:Contractile injection system tube protein
MGGSLELLKITGYTDEEFQTAFEGQPYLVMINPDSIKWQRSIDYNEQQTPDSSSASQKYKSTPSDKVNFDIVIDCTGIVDAKRTDMSAEISALEKIVFTYNGKIHRPNFVKIQWGQNISFKGVLTSFDISYTLFKPDGSPLRAKISLSFSQYISPKTVKKLDMQQSQDISHLVTVVEGMTLPQLCQEIWNDDSYYVQVARYNDLNKFRDLKGIENLIFPPILQSS